MPQATAIISQNKPTASILHQKVKIYSNLDLLTIPNKY